MPNALTARPGHPRASGTLWALTLALALAALSLPPLVHASGDAKVVIVVGPTGSHNADYKEQAREIAAEARRHTANVILVLTPKATWSRVRQAAAGASVFVYFGHGWGFPSHYTAYDPDRQNGMALDPASGANGTRRVYFGENRVRASIRLAPGAAVLLYRLCYASGNTEPHLREGTTSQSRRRVDGFGSGFLDTGAAIVIAEGHPRRPANYVRQLFTTDRTMLELFQAAPDFHRHLMGPYASMRTPGARYAMDPDRLGSDPSGFYRSLVGDLELRSTQVTRRAPYPAESPAPSEPGSAEPSASTGNPAPSSEPTASPPDPAAPLGPTPSPDPAAPPSEPTPAP